MIRSAFNPDISTPYRLLVEDIHLGMCSLHSRIWALSQSVPDRNKDEDDIFHQREALKRELEAWNRRLTQAYNGESDRPEPEQQMSTADYYQGYEDTSDGGWQDACIARKDALFSDAVALYRLLSLQLCAVAATLRLLARDHGAEPGEGQLAPNRHQARKQRERLVREWTRTPDARRALAHAWDILNTYRKQRAQGVHSFLDPITYTALCAGALVVWGCCRYGQHSCEVCKPRTSGLFLNTYVHRVELKELSEGASQEQKRTDWINMGGGMPVALDGVQLCRCTTERLMALFYECLPQGWSVAQTFAPNIFGFGEAAGLRP